MTSLLGYFTHLNSARQAGKQKAKQPLDSIPLQTESSPIVWPIINYLFWLHEHFASGLFLQLQALPSAHPHLQLH